MNISYFFYFSFMLSILIIIYTYMIYPALLFIFAKMKPNRKNEDANHDLKLPKVSVVVAAYNEEKVIEDKIRNTLDLDYPRELLEIIIGSDGSNDKTDEICRGHSNEIFFTRIEPRQGKANVLNTIVPMATGEILLFSDANTILEAGCLKKIVTHFANQSVGGVCGRLDLLSSKEAIVSFERLYWLYESKIKMMESKIHSTIGSNGGIYAIRKELFVKIPKDTIIDDFWISIDILEQNKRIVFEDSAVAYEKLSKSVVDEFFRKVRIGGGNMQTFMRRPLIRSQQNHMVNLLYYSHKVVRWSIPFMLILCYACLFMIRNQGIFQIIFVVWNFAMLMSLIGTLFEVKNKVFETVSYFFLFNAALFIGYIRYFIGKQSVIWKTAKR